MNEKFSEIQEIRSRIVNASLYVYAAFIAIPVVLSLARSSVMGWQNIMYLHLSFVVMAVATSVFSNRLSFRTRATIFLGLLFAGGSTGVFALGLIGSGIPVLFVFCIFSAILFGTRAGIAATLISLLTVGAIAAGVRAGAIVFNFSVETYSIAPMSWLNALVVLAFFTGLSVVALGLLHHYLIDSIHALKQRSTELLATNEQLEVEVNERERAEQARNVSDERLRMFMDSSTDVWMLLDSNLDIVDANKAAERGFGRGRDQLIGTNLGSIYPEAVSSGRYEKYAAVIETQEPLTLNSLSVKNADDDARIVIVRAFPVGNGLGMVSTDITDLRETEKALQESEARASAIMNSITESIFLLDLEGHILTINDTAAHRFAEGEKKELLIGRSVYDLVPPDIAAKRKAIVDEVIRTRESRLFEDMRQGRHILSHVYPVKNAEEKVYAVAIFAKDITERKHAEEALKRSKTELETLVAQRTVDLSAANKRLRIAIEELPFPIMIHAEDGEILQINKVWTQITGYTLEDIPTMADWTEKAYGDRQSFEKSKIDKLYDLKERTDEGEYEPTTRSGESRVWDFSSAPLGQLPDGRRMVISVAHDITEQKKAEEEKEELHRQLIVTSHQAGRAEVATGVLHNVGNVLNSINVSATLVSAWAHGLKFDGIAKSVNLLKENMDDLKPFLTKDEKGKNVLTYLSKLSEHLEQGRSNVIDEVASLTKNVDHVKEIVSVQQAHARMTGLIEATAVNDLLEDAVSINNEALERHHITVLREFADLPPMDVDKQKILQILINLMSNAKYALADAPRDEKLLTLRTRINGANRVIVEICDNGVGIPEDHITKIFSHGFSTRKDGHGFGLHASALAATELGGSLTARNNGKHAGATFTLEIPFKPGEEKR